MPLRTRYSPSKSYANCPAHPSLGQKRFNPALNLLNSHLSQHSLRNRWRASPNVLYPSERGYNGLREASRLGPTPTLGPPIRYSFIPGY